MGHVTNLFIEGPRGAGKTTLLLRLLREYCGGMSVGGFIVKRVYTDGRCVGMDLADFATRQRQRVLTYMPGGRPSISTDAFLRVGIPALLQAESHAGLVVMDELGRFELAVPEFIEAVWHILESDCPVLGVLKDESNWFLDRIRQRPDVQVSRLTAQSRLATEHRCRALLRQILGKRTH